MSNDQGTPVEDVNTLVERVIRALDAAGIPHMLVGSLSSNSYGVERSTQDADFVIELGSRSIAPVAEALAPDIRLDQQMSFESVTLTSRYQAVHTQTGFGIQFFLLADERFHQERFARRRKVPFGAVFAYLQSPEDVVIQKLRWYEKVKRSKDIEDVRNVLVVQKTHLDLDYIRAWCDQHGTRTRFETLWSELPDF